MSEIALYIALAIVGFFLLVWLGGWFLGWLAKNILLYLLFMLVAGLVAGWFVGWFILDGFTKYITSTYDPSRFWIAGFVAVVFWGWAVWVWSEVDKERMEKEEAEEQARLKEEDREAMRELIEELKADRESRSGRSD